MTTETIASNLEYMDPDSNIYKSFVGLKDFHTKNIIYENEKRLERLKLIEQTKKNGEINVT